MKSPRKHSSRMRTSRLPTVRASVGTRYQYYEGPYSKVPQVNKYEQVSSLGHQVSVPVGWGWAGGLFSGVPCPRGRVGSGSLSCTVRSHVWENHGQGVSVLCSEVSCPGVEWGLHSDVQCIIGNGPNSSPLPPPVDK